MSFVNRFYSDHTNQWLKTEGFELKSKLLKTVSNGAIDETEKVLLEYLHGLARYVGDDSVLAQDSLMFIWAQISAVAVNSGLDNWVSNTIIQRYFWSIEETETVPEMLDLCKDFVFEITEALAQQKIENNYSPLIRKCCIFIRRNIAEKLTVDLIAEELHFSAAYISRKFKKETNMSLTDYVRKEKISASKLLLKRNIPISQIAQELGFSSQSHFGKQFKQETGVTPNEYKKAIEQTVFNENNVFLITEE